MSFAAAYGLAARSPYFCVWIDIAPALLRALLLDNTFRIAAPQGSAEVPRGIYSSRSGEGLLDAALRLCRLLESPQQIPSDHLGRALGCHHFDELSHVLGIGSRVLSRRLAHMVEAGLLLSQDDMEDGRRRIYRLTPASRDLFGYILRSQVGPAAIFDPPAHRPAGTPSFRRWRAAIAARRCWPASALRNSEDTVKELMPEIPQQSILNYVAKDGSASQIPSRNSSTPAIRS